MNDQVVENSINRIALALEALADKFAPGWDTPAEPEEIDEDSVRLELGRWRSEDKRGEGDNRSHYTGDSAAIKASGRVSAEERGRGRSGRNSPWLAGGRRTMSSIARSSNSETAGRHCNGAAMHEQIGTPRDRSAMRIGTAVHHMIHGITTRADDEMPADAIDRVTADLIANGRRFEGGPVEHIDPERADRARDLALDFLDRKEIKALLEGGYDWVQAELSTSLDRSWKVVDRDMCRCGHRLHVVGDDRRSCSNLGCDCQPAAHWTGTQDLVAIFQEEDPDGQLVKVLLIKDWKGGNIDDGWFSRVQGKSAAICGVGIDEANNIGADILRREVTSYLPWGGSFSNDINLHDPEHLDMLADYRQALLVQIAGNAGRQGKTPDELAEPGAGCSNGYNGEPCPWLMVCGPYADQWHEVEILWPELAVGAKGVNREAWATFFTLSTAIRAEAAKRLKAGDGGLVDPVPTADNLSLVGWKKRGGSEVTSNAPTHLAKEFAEVLHALEPGSPRAIEVAAIIEGLLRVPKALGVTTCRALIARLDELLDRDEIAALEALCLEDNPGRALATWKA